MSQNPVPLLAVVLRNLRERAGWTQVRLEREARLSKGSLCRLEKGSQTVDRFLLNRLAKVMRIAEGDVEQALAVLEQLPAETGAGSSADLPVRDRQTIETVSARFSRMVREKAQNRIGGKVRARRWRLDRAAAAVAWQRLRKMPSEDRRLIVKAVEAFHTWAVVERLCEESVRAAASDMEEARRLAQLARQASTAASGAERRYKSLENYAAAFEANAWCAAGEFRKAEQIFAEVDALHGEGLDIAAVPVDWARPLIFRAVLMIYRANLDPALEWLNEALSLTRSPTVKTWALIWRAAVLKRKLQFPAALEELEKARPYAELAGDARLRWAIAFNEAGYLCEAGHLAEAAARLPALKLAALELGGALDRLRLRWLTARVAAASGLFQEAATNLSEVWNAFADRNLWLDAAIAVLELASINLEMGLSAQVKKLATASAHVFAAQTLPDHLLAAVRLFWQAALQEAATSQMARQLVGDLRRAMVANAEAS
ncbi:MAG: helix-turn-helix transcriptional regulator [Acidobacteriota bacterium]